MNTDAAVNPEPEITDGLCECGCGTPTKIAPYSNPSKKWIKGKPLRFVARHNLKKGGHAFHPHWKGGRWVNRGYVLIMRPDHPRASVDGYVPEHILIVEKILGHSLPPKAEIHHFNENKSDNRNENLVICRDRAYHMLLHQRTRAFRACGHADWVKCNVCKVYCESSGLTMSWDKRRNKPSHWVHPQCLRDYMRERWLRKKSLKESSLS